MSIADAASRREVLRLGLAAGASGAMARLTGIGTFAGRALAAGHATLPIGMNLAGIADYERGFPFLNLMWGSRIWITRNVSDAGPWDTEMAGALELDADGYPLEVPFTPAGGGPAQYVVTLLPNILKAGKYVILYDGEGAFTAGGATKIVDRQPGRIEIGMRHDGETVEEIAIRKSVRGNHVRNIRVLPIESEKADLDANPFRPEVLEFCKPWHCLRFMDWLGTNNSVNEHWSARKRRSFYTQVGTDGDVLGLSGAPLPAWQRKWGSGVALELCVQLANLTKTDAWFCVPHLADDEYIREMAKLVKAQLDPSLKVYLEFSNEMWNWAFGQATWMLRSELAGDAVAAAGASPPWKGGVKPSAFRDGVVVEGAGEGIDFPERVGALFNRCFKIWEEVFSGPDRQRLVRVCAVQAHWLDAASRTLAWVMRNGGCDAVAPAGYFGPDDEVYARWEAAGAALTADEVIADMRVMIADGRQRVADNANLAKEAGIRFVTYEGGQHIQPQGQAEKPYNPALAAAQADPAMYDLYRENLDLYAKAGCDLFSAFASVGRQGMRWGSWGHIERYGQDPATAPKYRAILEANAPRAKE